MQVSLIVLRQTAAMFLLMVVGFALYKTKRIDEPGSRSIASALLYAVLPATLINSLLLDFCSYFNTISTVGSLLSVPSSSSSAAL